MDVNVGQLYLRDQFEWPLFSNYQVTPEVFARSYCSDLGIGGEFVPLVSHSIREQVVLARLNFHEAEVPPMWRQRPFRREEDEDEWEPELRLLSEEEVKEMLKEQDRSSR